MDGTPKARQHPRRSALAALAFASSAAMGCGAEAPPDGLDAKAPPPPPASGIQLEVGPFHVPAGEEIFRCTVVKVEDTLLVDAIESFAGDDVHHFSVDATLATIPSGVYDCNDVFTSDVMQNSLTVYSTTRPHDRIRFGDGIAGKLPARFFTLILSYHYLNTTGEPQDVGGYLNIETTTKDKVKTLINGIVGATRRFVVPPQSERSFTKRCTTDRALDVLAVTSHAHEQLSLFEVSFIKNGARPEAPHHVATDGLNPDMTVFTDAPIHLEPGDAMEWTCHYKNPTDAPITEGERADQEMCQAIAIYAPDQGFLSCNVYDDQTEKPFKQLAPPASID